MKIALIRQRYTPYGGAERFVARAMEALGKQQTQLTIVTRKWQTTKDASALICDPFYLGSVWRDWGFANCVCNKLAQHNFDLVQSHERISCCDIYRAGDGVHREWLRQRKRVLGFFGGVGLALNPYHRYVLRAERELFESPRLKAIICNSGMVKQEIREYFNVAEEKLHVIYSGVDTTLFHPDLSQTHRMALRQRYNIPKEAPLFLFVGSGFARKGLAAALEALSKVANAHLMVVGGDKNMSAYQRAAQNLGISHRTYFAGPQRDILPFFASADTFLLPTLYDPFPNAALEAMACGLAIITSNKSGAAEFIQNGSNGFVCDALDVPDLARCLELLSVPGVAQTMGKAARETVEPYTLDSMTQKLQTLYRSLMA